MRLSVAFLLLFAIASPATASQPACLNASVRHSKSDVTNNVASPLTLEIAATPETREYGLMHRQNLAPCGGMAFFFPALSSAPLRFSPQKFWMKNTIIPLDILFLDEHHTIIYIETAIPLSLKPLGPDLPVATVIEIAGGRAKKEGIVVGDKVVYEIATNPWQLAH